MGREPDKHIVKREKKIIERTELKRKQLVDTAMHFLFVREATGNNDGYWVETWQKMSGGKKGQPWCTYFTVAMHKYCNIPIPETGLAYKLFETNVVYQANDWTNKNFRPQSGQVLGLSYGKGINHSGIIQYAEDDKVYTIEGNIGMFGKGDGVHERILRLSQINAISDYVGSKEIIMDWRKSGANIRLRTAKE